MPHPHQGRSSARDLDAQPARPLTDPDDRDGEITDDASYTTPTEFEAAYYSQKPMALEAVTQ